MTRTRLNYAMTTSGSWHHRTIPIGDSDHPVTYGYDFCEDVPGPGDCAPFRVAKARWEGGRITSLSNDVNQFDNRSCDWILAQDGYGTSHISIVQPPEGDLAVQLMKRTNPSQPKVDLVAEVAQMRLIPELLEFELKDLIKLGHQLNLNYQFMIKPVVDDIFSMIRFSDTTEKRIALLHRMREKGLRRTVTLFDKKDSEISNLTLVNSQGLFVSTRFRKETHSIIRGHARWAYDFGLIPSDEQLLNQARSAVFGVTLDLATLWEAVPWSWFIDWFTNVGDYLLAHRNTINASCSSLTLMHHRSTVVTSLDVNTDPRFEITPIKCTYETKDRVPATPAFEAELAFLSSNQLGILGSIGALNRL